MDFSEKLRSMRKEYKMSQEQLAEKLNVSRQAITKWETGGGLPDIENVLAIAELFQISLDELLSAKKKLPNTPDFIYESITEYDIDFEKHYDIHACEAHEIVICSTEREKIRVRLASNTISSLESSFKVKIDDIKKRLDIDIKQNQEVSKAQAKEALSLLISIPSKYMAGVELTAITNILRIDQMEFRNFEFDGKTRSVFLNDVSGYLEFNCSLDMNIVCNSLRG